ncbi:choline dehydrogenase 7, partial [Desmophyllum pertusum]
MHCSPADELYLFDRHGISRTDFNLLSDPELSFLEVVSKMPSNPGTTPMNKEMAEGFSQEIEDGTHRNQLVGSVAPTLSNLVDWLQQNSSYDVAEESAAFVRSK